MAQYTLGSVLLFKDSSTVYGSEATDWSGVDAICIFSVAGAYFQLASPSSQIAMTSFVSYDQAATYSRGDLARHGGKYYVARRSTVGEVPTINSQAWMPTSRWSLTLNTPCPLDDQVALYAIHKDFTPNLSLPLVRPTDRNAIALLGRAMMQLDTYSGPDAIPAHNTAPDSHADIRADLAGKQPSLTISPVGTALLNLSTPATVKIPRVNPDGSVTLIDVPSGGGAASTLDAAILADTPTAYWRCSEVSGNLDDSSGGAHTLTVSGTPVRSFSRLAHGLADEHIRWSSAYASLADTLGVAVPWTGSWSLEFVVLLPAGLSVEQGVFAVGVPLSETEANNYQLYASLETGRKPLLIWEYSSGNKVEFKPAPVLALGERYLIAWTKDAASKVVRCYIDGCCVFEASYTQEPTGGGNSVTAVGYNSSSGTSTAVLGHIAFWSGTVLSQERIQAHAVSAGVM